VTSASRAKIDIYTECQPQFVAAQDKYFAGVVDECIAKNRRYIEAIEGPQA
jgi:hypothetical protein